MRADAQITWFGAALSGSLGAARFTVRQVEQKLYTLESGDGKSMGFGASACPH
jgi:outer membrane usher protein FimD/PapC